MVESKTYAFPFVGAGDASYFEWAEVHVRFEFAPNRAQRRLIGKDVPPPLRDEVLWDGPNLRVSSGQFAHLDIAQAYQADEGERPELEGRFPSAAPSQVDRFNEDIERWLIDAHREVPIALAFRREDAESGGTRLSAWHEWSVTQLESALPSLVPPGADTRYVLDGVLGYVRNRAKLGLPAAIEDLLDPARASLQALEAGDLGALRQALASRGELSAEIFEQLEPHAATPKRLSLLLGAGDVLLADDEAPVSARMLARLGVEAARVSVNPGRAGEVEISEACVERVLAVVRGRARTSAELGNAVAELVATELGTRELRKPACVLNGAIIDNPHLQPYAYNNAIALLGWLSVEEGLLEMMESFLEPCLPNAPENPALYFNVANNYGIAGDHERALQYLELAKEHGFATLGDHRNDPEFQALRGTPRFEAVFAGLPTPAAEAPTRPNKRTKQTKKKR